MTPHLPYTLNAAACPSPKLRCRPEDYVREVKPGGRHDEWINPPFRLDAGKRYEVELTYKWTPDADLIRALNVPHKITTGTIQGTVSKLVAPKMQREVFVELANEDFRVREHVDAKTYQWLIANEFGKELDFLGIRETQISMTCNEDLEIQSLSLRGLELSEPRLRGLLGFNDLRAFGFSDMSIGKSQIAILRRFANLKRLNLEGEEVTDETLKHVSALSSIRYLSLHDVAITNAGMNAFRNSDFSDPYPEFSVIRSQQRTLSRVNLLHRD
ncbi:MAG: hypothetical protein AAGG48_31490 [Planctomycetota bacterium]